MRLFIATELSELHGLFKSLQSKFTGAVFTYPKSFHITYRFLGDTQPDRFLKGLSSVRFKRFSSNVSGIGYFPSEDNIRVIWAGLEMQDQFKALKNEIDSAIGMDGDVFVPHVTLARLKKVTNKESFQKSLKFNFDPVQCNISSFKLIGSSLTHAGPVYNTLKEFILG